MKRAYRPGLPELQRQLSGGQTLRPRLPPVRYPVDRMRAFVDGLHANGQRWIPIQDAGVAAAEGYAAYEAGRAAGIFVRDHKGDPYIGQVCDRG